MATGSLAAANAVSASVFVHPDQKVGVTLTGTWIGKVQLERSKDGGASFHVPPGTAVFTSNLTSDYLEPGYLYRLRMLAHTSGSASYDISAQSGDVIIFERGSISLRVRDGGLLLNGVSITTSDAFDPTGTGLSATTKSGAIVELKTLLDAINAVLT